MYFINESRCTIVFILLTCALYHKACALYHNDTELEVKFCGFEQRCSRNMTMQWSEWEFCCRPCECDDICLEKGTCCRDKEKVVTMDVKIQQKCLRSAYKPNGTNVQLIVPSYYTRTSCPKEYKNKNIKAKCESIRPKTITEVRPVSSFDGKIVYKNNYCSYCHGEQRTLGWDINVHRASSASCRNMLQNETPNIDTISTKMLSNCILYFIPPTNIDFWKVMCFENSNVIKQCNMTGRWKAYDSRINDLCLNQTDTGYFIFNEYGKAYYNLYCSVCNSYKQSVGNICLMAIGRNPHASLFTLLNFNKLFGQKNSKDKSRRCLHSEILDTYFDKCRTLHCFRGLIPFKGKCVPFLHNDVAYELLIKLVPKQQMKSTALTENDLRNNYIRIQDILGFGECGLCYLYILVTNNNTDSFLDKMYILYSFTPAYRCKIENILSNFMSVEATIPLINKEIIGFSAFQDAEFDKFILIHQYKIVLQVRSVTKCQSISPERGQICPQIKLLKEEVKHVMTYHPMKEELVWKKDVNGSAFVCCDKYLSNQASLSPFKLYPYFPIFFINIVFVYING